MASLELDGRIVRKMAVQRGTSARGEWQKQEFLLEYQDGNFPTQVCLNVWGADKVADLDRYQVGDEVKVSFRPSSREFNGRWYTDLRAWRVSPAGDGRQAAPQDVPSGFAPEAPARGGWGGDDVPAGFAPRASRQEPPAAAPAPTAEDMPADFGDDLPF